MSKVMVLDMKNETGIEPDSRMPCYTGILRTGKDAAYLVEQVAQRKEF